MDVLTMQGLHGIVRLVLGVFLATACTSLLATDHLADRVSVEHGRTMEREPGLPSMAVFRVFHEPGAAFVKLHFNELNLPPGITVEISSAGREEVYEYSAYSRDGFTFNAEDGDDGVKRFWAMSVSGDTAIVRVLGNRQRFNPAWHRIDIDRVFAPRNLLPAAPKADKNAPTDPSTESICGANERYDSVCWEDSHPLETGRAAPVAMIVTANGTKCTGWRVGPDNRMMTAAHCIASQAALSGSEVWFNHERTFCGSDENKTPVKVPGKDLLSTDATLDYSLFSVEGFSEIESFGYLGLDVRNGPMGEDIFIPQHGHGRPKQLALESDMNESGLCEIDAPSITGYAEDSDIGYFCDTTNNSSGAPVISRVTGRAIALHHLGGCFNQGTKISLIWNQVSGFFGNEVPGGDDDENWSVPNVLPSAVLTAECENLVCAFDASDSFDPDGQIVDYMWDFGDGSEALGATIEHGFAEAGSYEVSLTVEDDEGATANRQMTVELTAANARPDARFSTACVLNDCIFDASSSADSDGEIIAYKWVLGDGNTGDSAIVEHSYDSASEFTVVLTVVDDKEAEDSTSHTVSVSLPNELPEARFSWSCDSLDCEFDASASTDPDGDITAYAWDFGNQTEGQGRHATVNYEDSGSFTVSLTVTDSNGSTSSKQRTIEVSKPQVAPRAAFTFVCTELTCNLDASSSTNGTNDITDYDWNLGDGSSGEGKTLVHVFEETGTYSVQLRVRDSQGETDTHSRVIRVEQDRVIELRVSGIPSRKGTTAVLTWHGAASDSVSIMRNGLEIAQVANRGKFTDSELSGTAKANQYQVCESTGGTCSNTVRFHSTKR